MLIPTINVLEQAYQRCSDGGLHPDYVRLLESLEICELTEELIAYLLEKCLSKKHIWEIRFQHLRILLINPSARNFDLKAFYEERVKKARRLSLKMFYIRGYAMYATEEELSPVMDKFCASLEKNHDYIDYNDILSEAGLSYLVNTYGYECFRRAYQKAQEEAQRISPLLLGGFTRDHNLKCVNLLPTEEVIRRQQQFLEERK